VRAHAKHKLEETKAYVSETKEDLLGNKENLLGKATESSPESAVPAANPSVQKARKHPVRSRRSAPLRSAGRSGAGQGAALSLELKTADGRGAAAVDE